MRLLLDRTNQNQLDLEFLRLLFNNENQPEVSEVIIRQN